MIATFNFSLTYTAQTFKNNSPELPADPGITKASF